MNIEYLRKLFVKYVFKYFVKIVFQMKYLLVDNDLYTDSVENTIKVFQLLFK